MIRRHPRNTPGAMNCIQVGRVLQRHLDGELDTETAQLVALHLEDCRRCGMTAREYRNIKRALGQSGRDDAAIARLREFASSLGTSGPEGAEDPDDDDRSGRGTP